MNILIADDNEQIFLLLNMILNHQGHQCTWAPNGKEALNILHKSTHFDLIILDLNMPIFSGMQFMHTYKNEIKQPIPIIISSTEVKFEFLRKPITQEDLLEKIDQIMLHWNEPLKKKGTLP